jgi:hypothetical protein
VRCISKPEILLQPEFNLNAFQKHRRISRLLFITVINVLLVDAWAYLFEICGFKKVNVKISDDERQINTLTRLTQVYTAYIFLRILYGC